MNGTYKSLVEYITQEQYAEIDSYEKSRSKEFQFRFKNFCDKYMDQVINNIIEQIKSCNILSVYTQEIWTLEYSILGSDIKIIDPENPDNSMNALTIFFKKCCEILKIEFVNYELTRQEGDNIFMTISFKNPLWGKYIKNIESLTQ